MGQSFCIVNLDKRQFIHPHKLGDGYKLCELATGNTMLALAALLADGNGGSGGDIRSSDPLIGSWAGDRIVVAGEYADRGRFIPTNATADTTLHDLADETFDDVSWKIAEAVCQDSYVRERLLQSYWSEELVPPFLRDEWNAYQSAESA